MTVKCTNTFTVSTGPSTSSSVTAESLLSTASVCIRSGQADIHSCLSCPKSQLDHSFATAALLSPPSTGLTSQLPCSYPYLSTHTQHSTWHSFPHTDSRGRRETSELYWFSRNTLSSNINHSAANRNSERRTWPPMRRLVQTILIVF